jgi:hypothetical protein
LRYPASLVFGKKKKQTLYVLRGIFSFARFSSAKEQAGRY